MLVGTMFDRVVDFLDSLVTRIAKYINYIGMATLILCMFLVTGDVIGRYLGHPIPGALELTELSLVLIATLGFAWTMVVRGHISIDFLTRRMPERTQAALEIVTSLLMLGIWGIIARQTYLIAFVSKKQTTDTLEISVLPFKLLVSIGAMLMCLVLAFIVIKSIRKATAGISRRKLFLRGILPGLVVCLLVLAAFMYLQANTISPQTAGIASFALLLFLMALGLPIHAAFAIVGFLGYGYLMGWKASFPLIGITPYHWASHDVLVTVPMFVLMGMFAYHSGISRALFDTGYRWLGRLHGGLAIATTAACTGFAACTGSSVAGAATMGTIAIPEMLRFNYDSKLAAGVVAAGGTLGILIPPSTGFIVFGLLTEVSIGRLFLAGLFPGLLISLMFMTMIYIRARRNPLMAPRGEAFSWRERMISLKGVSGMLLIFVLVMGGLFTGIFTPTEAGAVGAFGAFLIALYRRSLNKHTLLQALADTVRVTVMIVAILIGAMIYSHFIALSGVATTISEWVGGLPLPRHAVLAMILLAYVPLGMFMDAFGMIVLTLPIFFPIVTEGLGFSPVLFGVLMVVMLELAAITPPVGLNVYVLDGLKTGIRMEDIFKGIIPFAIVFLLALIPLIAFPQISLFLPNLIIGK